MTEEIELKIKDVIQRTYNVKSIRLEASDDKAFKPGQYLIVKIKSGGKELIKALSISSSPTEKGYIEFTKKLTQSEFSNALDRLNKGDLIRVRYPLGAFTFEGEYPKLAFLSGGIGVTPIRSICKNAVDKNIGADMVLIYGNRSAKDIVFRDDFDLMQKQYPKLKIVHVLCESAAEIECVIGVINSQVIKNNIPDYLERRFYLCGPPGMVEAMKNILLNELMVTKENIVTEKFAGY